VAEPVEGWAVAELGVDRQCSEEAGEAGGDSVLEERWRQWSSSEVEDGGRDPSGNKFYKNQ
jgi:hypothetical protein